MRRETVLTAVLILLLAAAGLIAILLRGSSRTHAPAENFAYRTVGTEELPRLWQAPEFSYPDQHGTPVTPAALQGRPWIVDFIFTQCTTVCPLITAKMVLLQRALAGVDMRFVSLSVDPEHDSSPVLAAYATRWNPGEARWVLLATEKRRLVDTARGFRVTIEASDDPVNPVIHSSVFLLVDAEGWIRGVYDSNDDDAIRRLTQHARQLAARPTAPPPATRSTDAFPVAHPESTASDTAQGDLYTALGCAGCHANRRLAPALENIIGREVVLADSTKVIADAEYVRRSITEPGAQIVAGYVPLMPTYAHDLSAAQLAHLVEEVGQMRSEAAPRVESIPARLVVDPVCGMQVRATRDAPRTKHHGRVVYFCSERCRDLFVAHPAAYSSRRAVHAHPVP